MGVSSSASFRFVEPVGYLESIALQAGAAVVFTDSGGVQEEASHLDVPCLTLRPNTERPVTVELGSSTLVGNNPADIESAFRRVRSGRYKHARPIPLWDGRAAERAAEAIAEWLEADDPIGSGPVCAMTPVEAAGRPREELV